jgi:hypothetical protein
MRLDDQGRPGISGLGETLLELCQVAGQNRADIGVDNCRRDPLELLDLGQHFRGERHIGAGQGLRYRLARGVLVTSVAPGMQIAHRDRFDPLVP